MTLTTSGVYAIWRYFLPAEDANSSFSANVNEFSYAPPECLYITNVELVSNNASLTSLSYDYEFPTMVEFWANNKQASSSVTFRVTV